MKTEVWLDTTALVDLTIRSTPLRDSILRLFPPGTGYGTSRYVLFEFARSVLRRYIRLHNKAAEFNTLSSLLHYIGNCNVGSQRTASTMLGAYTDYVRFQEEKNFALTPGQQMEELRSFLARQIRRSWNRASRLATANPIGCRDDLPAPRATKPDPKNPTFEHYIQELPMRQCGQPDNCGLIHSLQNNPAPFRAMSSALAALPEKDSETTSRIPALQRLMAHDKATPFDGKDCYRCGDAIIAGEAPAATTILSKNAKHFQPLCDAIPRPLVTYKEPAPAATTAN